MAAREKAVAARAEIRAGRDPAESGRRAARRENEALSNARDAADYFHIRTNRVIELGTQVET